MTNRNITLLILMLLAVFSAEGRRVLFIGDSITDGAWGNSKVWNTPSEERNHKDMNHIYGHGYMMICASHYQALYPDSSFVFWNRGISGNTLADLRARWQKDAIALEPDVISILIGTNDVGKALGKHLPFDVDTWENDYRNLLDSTRLALPDVRFVLCTPFVAPTGKLRDSEDYTERERLINCLAQRIERIASDYDAVLVPFNGLISELVKTQPSETYWIWDGIHPTPAAHYRMAQLWMEKAGFVVLDE